MTITRDVFKKIHGSTRKRGRPLFRRGGDWLVERRDRAARIAGLAEDGKIAIVSGGRDCDGVQWEGCVSLIPASVMAYEKHISDAKEWADGPMWFYLSKPSCAEHIEYSSRDLGMEAFENGHPWVLRP